MTWRELGYENLLLNGNGHELLHRTCKTRRKLSQNEIRGALLFKPQHYTKKLGSKRLQELNRLHTVSKNSQNHSSSSEPELNTKRTEILRKIRKEKTFMDFFQRRGKAFQITSKTSSSN